MKKIYRVLDANLNRAREGLRVVEEVVRFIWDDAILSSSVKNVRHGLQKASSYLPVEIYDLIDARDSTGDVGAEGITDSEMGRVTLNDLVIANIIRVQEAARVLEEFSKFTSPDAAKYFKNFRFEVYNLEKEIIENRKKKSLLDFHLYVILGDDGTLGDKDIISAAKDAILGGAGIIQMRIKNSGTRDLLETGRKLRELTSAEGITFIVNDRADIALAVNADGVHLGQDDLPPRVARNILGPGKIIGISTHSGEQALQAVRDGADYIGVGPVFATGTKIEAGSPVGTDLLRAVSKKIQIPIVAIGGINADNVVKVLETGVTRCAVISAVTSASDVVSATRRIKSAILSGRSKQDDSSTISKEGNNNS